MLPHQYLYVLSASLALLTATLAFVGQLSTNDERSVWRYRGEAALILLSKTRLSEMPSVVARVSFESIRHPLVWIAMLVFSFSAFGMAFAAYSQPRDAFKVVSILSVLLLAFVSVRMAIAHQVRSINEGLSNSDLQPQHREKLSSQLSSLQSDANFGLEESERIGSYVSLFMLVTLPLLALSDDVAGSWFASVLTFYFYYCVIALLWFGFTIFSSVWVRLGELEFDSTSMFG